MLNIYKIRFIMWSKTMRSNFMIYFAAKMPKTIVYFCANQLLAKVSTSVFSSQNVNDISAIDALRAYGEKYGI